MHQQLVVICIKLMVPPKSNSWKELSEGLMEDMDRPTPREGHSMVAADNNMNPIIFGGIGYGYDRNLLGEVINSHV